MVIRSMIAGGLALACLACSGGTRPRTELVLVADTDIAELTRVVFEVSGEGRGGEQREAAPPRDGSALSVGVVRENGPIGPLLASARGFVGDDEVIARYAEVSFVPGRTLVVPLHLLRGCMDVRCGAGETCTEQGCEDRALAPERLAEWPKMPPDVELTLPEEDGGSAEAGTLEDAAGDDATPPDMDSAVEAGEPDADPEASTPDAESGVPEAGATDDGATDGSLDEASTPEAGSDGGSDASTCSGTPVDTMTNPNHCGYCGNVCPASLGSWLHDVPACASGTCVFVCAPSYADCNGVNNWVEHCETNLGTDEDHCGGCGRRCATLESCINGVCTR